MTLWPNGTTSKPYVTSSFGPRNLPNPNASKYHRGVDMVGFTLVRAVEAGQVKVTGTPSNWKGGGIQVWVQHNGFFSRSLHLASYSVREDQFVREGDVLGVMGRTPNVDLHLHLEISPGSVHYSNSGQIDPVPFLSARINGGSAAGGESKPALNPEVKKEIEDDEMTMTYINLVGGKYSAGTFAVMRSNDGELFAKRVTKDTHLPNVPVLSDAALTKWLGIMTFQDL